MSAVHPVRRKITARAAAEQFGCSVRTVKRIAAEPRTEVESRAKARRDRAVELRNQGLKYREIAEEMGVAIGSVATLLHAARRLAPASEPAVKKRRTRTQQIA